MESAEFLLQLVAVLLSARIFGELAGFCKTPAVIGELLAGVIIGPGVLGIVDLTPFLQLLSQIGIILLLFEVGTETDIAKLLSAGKKSAVVALGGVLLPFISGFFLSRYGFGLPGIGSLFIAATLTATSIGITVRVLRDARKHNGKEAQIILGAAVLDDIIGIVLLAMLYEFSVNGQINLLNAGKVLLCIALFFLFAPFAAKILAIGIKNLEKKSSIPGLIPTMTISVILLFAWIAHSLGAPELLGGFAAGIALSGRFSLPFTKFLSDTKQFNKRAGEQLHPIIHIFSPIFFVTVGLSLNFREIDWTSSVLWTLTVSLFFVAVFGKLLSGFFLPKESLKSKTIIGTAMIPRGEVGLIFANVGMTSGVFSSEIYTGLIVVIALTTLLAPIALKFLYRKRKSLA